MHFVDSGSVAIRVTERDDGTRTVMLYTEDGDREYEIRDEDDLEIRVTAGVKEHNGVAHPIIRDVRASRHYQDEIDLQDQ